jgi:Uncharacterised nucleotidyltransferase
MVTSQQILLLKAALLAPAEAQPYWQRWCSEQNLTALSEPHNATFEAFLTQLDQGSRRLMPLIYKNLANSGDPFVAFLKNNYRLTWMQNQRVMLKVTEAVAALQAEGIETILLKGLAMGLVYYQDLGVRPTADGDVLVPTKDLKRAVEILKKDPYNYQINPLDHSLSRYIHAAHLFDNDRFDFDIHWHLLFLNNTPAADAPFWRDKKPFVLHNNTPTTVLSPTHQVLHNLVHGNFPDPTPAIRWVADCYVIYQKYEIDWLEILTIAQEKRLLVPVLEGIVWLQKNFGLTLNSDVVAMLEKIKPTQTEIAYFDFLKRNVMKKANLAKAVKFYRKTRFEYDLYHADYYQISYPSYALRKFVKRTEAYLNGA